MKTGRLKNQGTLLFERGGQYFGCLSPGESIQIEAYGTGSRPVLTAYKLLNKPSAWTPHSTDVWKIKLIDSNTHDGYKSPISNIGFIRTDSQIRAVKRPTLKALTEEWDFYCDDAYLYVRVAANPCELAADIRAAPNGTLIKARDGLTVTGVELQGCGGHGIAGTASDVTIQNCKVHELGGSYLPGYRDGTVRYGNGIETWIGSTGWLVEANEISQTYDVGYTAQGMADSARNRWSDITIRNNYIHHCTQSVEFWAHGDPVPGSGFARVTFEGNVCTDAGESWAAAVRPDQHVRVHLLTYSWSLPAQVTVRRNIFARAAVAYRYSTEETPGLTCMENSISLHSGRLMQWQHPETIEQAIEWATANQTEMGSTFATL
jgi:hypothetical protein